MSIELTTEDQELVNRLVKAGEFRDVNEAVHAALKQLASAQSRSVFSAGGPVYPPGSLLDLYEDAEENAREARIANAHPKKLEAF
jgi:hypothetical protein